MPYDRFGPYRTTVDFEIPRNERIRRAGFIWVSKEALVTKLPSEGTGILTLGLVFVRFNRKRVEREEARRRLAELKVTPRGMDWAVGSAAVLDHLEYPVLALGTEDTTDVVSIDGYGSKKMLTTFDATFTRFEHWFFIGSVPD